MTTFKSRGKSSISQYNWKPSLPHLAIKKRPDIALSASIFGQFVESTTQIHVKAAFKVPRYLRGTRSYTLNLTPAISTQLNLHTAVNWGLDISPQKNNRTGTIIRYVNAPTFWTSQSQAGVSLSTSEAEYMAFSNAAKTIIWLRCGLTELQMYQDCTVVN